MGGDMCMTVFYIFAALRIHVMKFRKKGILLSSLYLGKLRSDTRGGSSHGEAKGSSQDCKVNPSFLAPPERFQGVDLIIPGSYLCV